MKKKIKNNYIQGYIEGFYGKLLAWESRKLIIKSLAKNKMNTYLYAPKEDKNHRLNWRTEYSLAWRKKFREFTHYSKNLNVNVVAGVAPGLDFNFKSLNNYSKSVKISDFDLLYNKSIQLLEDGATSIALLLDDIPDNFKKNFGHNISEGTSHGLLANKLLEKLGQKMFFVPRIYADELILSEPKYLSDLSNVLNKDIDVFYCGVNVVSEFLTKNSEIKKILQNKIIHWDNYYTNDYCPRRFFIGPYLGREGLNNLMINPTGLINTDLLILDIFANTLNKKEPIKDWLEILHNHGVPLVFDKIKLFFSKPEFGSKPSLIPYKVTSEHFEALEFLLWSWKSKISREWYPYLFGLKHDLQLNQRALTSERLIKTQTLPLAQHLNKILEKDN
jgi:hyaluronoglucosaminidase